MSHIEATPEFPGYYNRRTGKQRRQEKEEKRGGGVECGLLDQFYDNSQSSLYRSVPCFSCGLVPVQVVPVQFQERGNLTYLINYILIRIHINVEYVMRR